MYDVHGGVSDSLDVVVLAPNHPKLRNELGAHEILLADGVQCAIELKPDLSDLPEGFGVDRRQKPEIIRALEQVRSVKRLRRERAGVLVGFEPELSAAYTEHVHRLPCHLVTAKAAPVDLCSYVASYYVKHNVPLVEQVDMVLVLGQALLVNTKAPEHGFQPSSSETWFSSIVALDYQKDALAGFVVRLMAEVGPELTMSTPVLCTYLGKIPPPRVLAGFVNTVSGSVFNAVGNATGNPVPALTAAAGKLGPRSDQNG